MATTVPVPGTIVRAGAGIGPGGDTGLMGPGEDVGSMKPWPAAAAPPSWHLCDGAALSRTLYPDLFALLGTSWGAGDGSSTFNVPDFRGRFLLPAGQGTGLTNRVLAASGGEENHQLTVAELASHTHPSFYQTNAASGTVGTGVGSAGPSVPSGVTGGNTPHNNMPPFLVVTYIIKVSLTGGSTAQAPIADTTQNGLLRKVSGVNTDYVDGTNNSRPLGNVLGPALITNNPDAPWVYGPYDDHFDGASLDPKWSLNAATGLQTPATTVGGSRVCVNAGNPADATNRVCNLIETVSLSPPVSIRAKLQGIGTLAAGTGGVVGFCLGLYNGSLSSVRTRFSVVAAAAFGTTSMTLVLTTEYGANFAGGSSTILFHGGVAPYWRLDLNADNTTNSYFSYDGINWGRLLAITSAAQNGFGTNAPNTFFIGLMMTQSSNAQIFCDWVRFQ